MLPNPVLPRGAALCCTAQYRALRFAQRIFAQV
jgi:hypothetical protein